VGIVVKCLECGNEVPKQNKKFCSLSCSVSFTNRTNKKRTPEQLWDSLVKRFWEYIKKGEVDECWEWQGAKDTSTGYGVIGSGRQGIKGRTQRIHRVSWKIHFGDPGDQYVLHKCDNRPCGNPHHLFLGTHQDNMKDRDQKGRGLMGEQANQAKLTEREVKEIKIRLANRESHRNIAKLYKVSPSIICRINTGKAWKHVKED
jgi:HNH endonuclease